MPERWILLSEDAAQDRTRYLSAVGRGDVSVLVLRSGRMAVSPEVGSAVRIGSELFAHFREASGSGLPATYVRVVRLAAQSRRPVGHVELKTTDKTQPDEGEAVLFIAPAFRRRGYGREAILALIADAARWTAFTTALAVCNPSNAASLRVVSTTGFEPVRRTSGAVWFRRAIGESSDCLA